MLSELFEGLPHRNYVKVLIYSGFPIEEEEDYNIGDELLKRNYNPVPSIIYKELERECFAVDKETVLTNREILKESQENISKTFQPKLSQAILDDFPKYPEVVMSLVGGERIRFVRQVIYIHNHERLRRLIEGAIIANLPLSDIRKGYRKLTRLDLENKVLMSYLYYFWNVRDRVLERKNVSKFTIIEYCHEGTSDLYHNYSWYSICTPTEFKADLGISDGKDRENMQEMMLSRLQGNMNKALMGSRPLSRTQVNLLTQLENMIHERAGEGEDKYRKEIERIKERITFLKKQSPSIGQLPAIEAEGDPVQDEPAFPEGK